MNCNLGRQQITDYFDSEQISNENGLCSPQGYPGDLSDSNESNDTFPQSEQSNPSSSTFSISSAAEESTLESTASGVQADESDAKSELRNLWL